MSADQVSFYLAGGMTLLHLVSLTEHPCACDRLYAVVFAAFALPPPDIFVVVNGLSSSICKVMLLKFMLSDSWRAGTLGKTSSQISNCEYDAGKRR